MYRVYVGYKMWEKSFFLLDTYLRIFLILNYNFISLKFLSLAYLEM